MTSRAPEISAYLYRHGQTPVATLAAVLGASLATIRRNLTQMEAAGLVDRLHGAAQLAAAVRAEVGFKAREAHNLAAKRAIALAAYRRIRPGSTILLDAGTTVLQLARQIRLAPLPLTVVTNGLPVAQELADVAQVQLCLLGGHLRPGHLSVIGPLAEQMLRGLWVDECFLGASAIANDGTISGFDADEARLNACMADRSGQVTVLADHSKLDRRATYRVLNLASGCALITDRQPAPALAEIPGLSLTVADEPPDV